MTPATAPLAPVHPSPAPDPRARHVWGIAVLWTALVAALGYTALNTRVDSARHMALAAAGVRLNAVKDTTAIAFGQWSAVPRSLAHSPDVVDFLATHPHPEWLIGNAQGGYTIQMGGGQSVDFSASASSRRCVSSTVSCRWARILSVLSRAASTSAESCELV